MLRISAERAPEAIAFFRLPGENKAQAFLQFSQPHILPSLNELNSCGRGFVVSPFAIGRAAAAATSAARLCFIAPDEETTFIPAARETLPPLAFPADGDTLHADYIRSFRVAHQALLRGTCEKVVLARRLPVRLPSPTLAQMESLFAAACLRYPDNYIALWAIGGREAWLVATPELLLQTDGPEFSTMALAGTMTWEEHISGKPWSEKNRAEQALVAQTLQQSLLPLTQTLDIALLHTEQAATLAHLCTRFKGIRRPDVTVSRLIEALHPTPAVAGLPLPAALSTIAAAEDFSRSYYAGFSGLWNAGKACRLFVSLRCMQWQADGNAYLYAGGGLLPESMPEAEWTETSRKLRTILDLLQ